MAGLLVAWAEAGSCSRPLIRFPGATLLSKAAAAYPPPLPILALPTPRRPQARACATTATPHASRSNEQRNAWRTPFFCNPIVHCTLVNRARALSRGSIQPRYKKSIQLSVGCSFFSEKINFRSRFSFPFELRRECFRVNFFHSRRRSNGITVASLRLYRLFHDS